MKFFFGDDSILDREVRNGPFEGDPALMCFIFSCVFHFHVLISLYSFIPFFVFSLDVFVLSCIFSNMFHCRHLYQSPTLDVSSVVGAPWRCGVLTIPGGVAGIGLGHQLGRERDSTPQSGVEAPRLLNRSLSRLDCCCHCC